MKKNSKNKAINWIIFLIIIFVAFILWKHNNTPKETPKQEPVVKTTPISITSKDIKEENFSGTAPVIAGVSTLAIDARAYVAQRVAEFRTQANTDVPPMKKEFGPDSPTANYTIDISAKYLKNSKTESIVMSDYAYTGGANGNSLYKVITASTGGEKILSLSDVIKTDKQDAFVGFVKQKLNDWRPEGSTDTVVFPDAVEGLTFDNFSNWSLDDKNLSIYFDKYAIGPGVLGAIVFPLPVEQIKDFLNPTYN